MGSPHTSLRQRTPLLHYSVFIMNENHTIRRADYRVATRVARVNKAASAAAVACHHEVAVPTTSSSSTTNTQVQ